MKKKLFVLILIFVNCVFVFTDEDYTPLTVREIIKIRKLSDEMFNETLYKHGISFLLDDEKKQQLKSAGLPKQRIEFIQNEIVPVIFITEQQFENKISFSILNINKINELRISQIEAELLSYEAVYDSKNIELGIVKAIETSDLVLPFKQTKLLTDKLSISLKPSEIEAFSTPLHVEKSYSDFTGYFRFKISFFKNNEQRMRYTYSDKIYKFSQKNKQIEFYTANQIMALLKKQSIQPKWLEAKSLLMIGDFRCLKYILNELKKDKGKKTEEIAKILKKTNDYYLYDLLIDILEKDNDDYYRSYASLLLGKLGEKIAMEPLIASLQDNFYLVRQNSAVALGLINDSRAVEPLLLVANKDKNKDVREAAKWALDAIKQQM